MNSRAKGARGERDAAAAWTSVFGCAARRGQQFAGGTDSPDILTAMQGVHVEVKRTERGNPYAWIEQAADDADGKVPLVMHRRNGKGWLVIARLEDVPRLATEVAASSQGMGGGAVPSDVPSQGVPPRCVDDA